MGPDYQAIAITIDPAIARLIKVRLDQESVDCRMRKSRGMDHGFKDLDIVYVIEVSGQHLQANQILKELKETDSRVRNGLSEYPAVYDGEPPPGRVSPKR